MSLRTRINGLTAWVNLRLRPYDHLMNNVVMDLLTGTNIKMLLQSLTGREMKKLTSLDGMTQQQKMTRMEWIIAELKKWKVVPEDTTVDTRMFAMRSADHIFLLLWRLVGHDIQFVWERLQYLQQDDDAILSEVPFKWVPEPPPERKKEKRKTRKTQSLLSGFGASSVITESIEEDSEPPPEGPPEGYEPFPQAEFMKNFKPDRKERSEYPAPPTCILEMVNSQIKTVHEGKKLRVQTVDDLCDSRVLCALVNSFVPNCYTTEVLLNDRWTINLVLRTTEQMFYTSSPVDSEDLVEADCMAMCSYFCVFFMVAFKYRQCKAAISRKEFVHRTVQDLKNELEQFPAVVSSQQELQQRKDVKNRIDVLTEMLEELDNKFDFEFCYKWMDHVSGCVKEVHQTIHQKIKQRFETLQVPRNITINDLCLSLVINLALTNGSGFYLADGKEVLGEGRKIILRDKETGDFFDDFNNKDRDICRKMLGLPPKVAVDINTKHYRKYEIFLEAHSRNKMLKEDTVFLYQVFPGTYMTWQKILMKGIRENEIEAIKRMTTFFKNESEFINCKEPTTGNSPLYAACRLGHFEIALSLLENGADVDQKNHHKQTPLFAACEGLHRSVAHLLIEWGCDVHAKGPRAQTAFETIKNDEFRDHLIGIYEHYSTVVPHIMEGDTELLAQIVNDHKTGLHQLCHLRSRCINGSTLLHTASYFDAIPVIRELLKMQLDVNLLDYKGATPLHRAKDVETMKVLMDAGARPNVEDAEGNSPLHVKCYGETNKTSETGAVALLLAMGAKLATRNQRGLLPIHCAAMQGRVDVIRMLLQNDRLDDIRGALEQERTRTPPSLPYLALSNDFIECAIWLVDSAFYFKDGEQDILLQRILSEQIKMQNRADAVNFLLDQGASPTIKYPGGNTALHYAASMSGPTDVLELLVTYGADLDAPNDEHATPLFFACQCNNQFAASVLLSHNANVRARNAQGLTAFDFIMDYDEWIESGYFSDEIRARLKAYSLKHARDLIRAISKKVKTPQRNWLHGLQNSHKASGVGGGGAPLTAHSSMSFVTPSRFSFHSEPSGPAISRAGISLPPLPTSSQQPAQ